jgi:hypothetical protein
MPRSLEQGKRPEQQRPAIYYLASRFTTREEAAIPYFAVQETLRTNPCDLSAYRFKQQWEEPGDKPWYVLVLGRTPIQAVQEQLTEALSVGEMTTIPPEPLLELARRRKDKQKHGSWVEAHYGESGLGIKFSRRARGKGHRRR